MENENYQEAEPSEEETSPEKPNITRREFLKNAALFAGGAAIIGGEFYLAESAENNDKVFHEEATVLEMKYIPKPVPESSAGAPARWEFYFSINGETKMVDIDEEGYAEGWKNLKEGDLVDLKYTAPALLGNKIVIKSISLIK
jgi:hypothetical protein